MLPVNSAADYSFWSRDSRFTTNVEGHEVEGQGRDTKTNCGVSHASLRIIVREYVRVLMTRGYVDDSLLASSGSGVNLAVWNRGSSC